MSSEFLEKDLVYVSSSNRLSGSSNDFTIDLSDQIRPIDYDSITLLNFSCPKSYYLINSYNNTFTVLESKTTTTITVPVGNYILSNLTSALTTALTACSFTYAVAIDKRIGKYTFTVSGNLSQPTFTFDDGLAYVLGFEETSYTFASNILTSINVVNLQLTNTIELMSDVVRNSVLSVVIPAISDFSVINYNEPNPSFASKELVRSNIKSGRFYLIDGNTGTPLDLNGLNFNFTFAIYKKNTYYNKMLEDKKLELYLQSLKDSI